MSEYLARTPASAAMASHFRSVLPGGDTRSVSFFAPYPLTIERGSGGCVVDVDGNEYLDVLNNYTALVHGHAFGPIVDALARAARDGSVHPAPHARQLRLAQTITQRYPAAELVRFTNSGTEAAVLAARIARRATGRQRIVMFEGGYHGTAPDFVGETADTIRVPYNDLDAVSAVLDNRVAAVFAEPFLGSGGVIAAAEGFLRGVEALARSAGAVFVLDEVQSLRSAYAGVHGALGLRPDLLLMGKLIGGGLPVGAVVGRGELLELTAAARRDSLLHSGTFNGNVLTCAAGEESLRFLDASAIERLNGCAGRLEADIVTAADKSGVAIETTRSGSIIQVHTSGAGRNTDPTMAAALHLALLLEGVYAAPRGMLNLSTALGEEELRRVADGYRGAFARLGALREGIGAT